MTFGDIISAIKTEQTVAWSGIADDERHWYSSSSVAAGAWKAGVLHVPAFLGGVRPQETSGRR